MRNLITRTVTGIEAIVKVVDRETEQVVIEKITLNKTKALETDDGLKKAVTKALPENKVFLSVVDKQEINKCYGVEISKFMEIAQELDPVTRAKLATDETEAEEATQE